MAHSCVLLKDYFKDDIAIIKSLASPNRTENNKFLAPCLTHAIGWVSVAVSQTSCCVLKLAVFW